MRVIRVYRRVESETLQLPELKEFGGKDVEILVLGESSGPSQQPRDRRDYSALAQTQDRTSSIPGHTKSFALADMI